MSSLWDATYVVTDVETTGSDPYSHRIIEIACVVVRAGEIAERMHSLVNPHQFVPPFIEQLTGITNADVYAAPEECEVMPLVEQLLRQPGAVFVAHQELFDWRFVERALQRCGCAVWQVPRLCTLRLARRLLPTERKKNLGALAEYFGIPINGRHRALGDAQATAHVLLCLLEELERRGISTLEEALRFQHQRLSSRSIPKRVLKAVEPYLAALPSLPGVYSMYDADDALLYVGKAKVLSERVRSYFQPSALHAAHIERMVRQVHRIEWEETATELSALLLEAERIRTLQPPFNVLHRRVRQYPLLRLTDEPFPRLELTMHHDGKGEYFGPFPHRGMAEELRSIIEDMFMLRRCSDAFEPSPRNRPCFYFHLRRCGAPCCGEQSPDEYGREVERVRQLLHGSANWLVEYLRQQMHAAAERLEFEQAERLLRRIRELEKLTQRMPTPSASLAQFNLALAIPTAYHEPTIELFAFVRGRLAVQRVVGRRQQLAPIAHELVQSFHATNVEHELTLHQMSTLRIVTSWMYHNREQARMQVLDPQWTPDELTQQLERVVQGESVRLPVVYQPVEEA
jgi:DNA polymerase-3 subunit epsilon